eukprot:GHVP01065691.1.p1 GENE.GHVP01065691.1~~GHVP01065691.1.p1  ORF type:complete len:262 (+),score=44.48 GHVP01065691.1:1336-2121(+)
MKWYFVATFCQILGKSVHYPCYEKEVCPDGMRLLEEAGIEMPLLPTRGSITGHPLEPPKHPNTMADGMYVAVHQVHTTASASSSKKVVNRGLMLFSVSFGTFLGSLSCLSCLIFRKGLQQTAGLGFAGNRPLKRTFAEDGEFISSHTFIDNSPLLVQQSNVNNSPLIEMESLEIIGEVAQENEKEFEQEDTATKNETDEVKVDNKESPIMATESPKLATATESPKMATDESSPKIDTDEVTPNASDPGHVVPKIDSEVSPK